MMAGVAEPPYPALYFTPFQFQGLWLEVIITPPAAFKIHDRIRERGRRSVVVGEIHDDARLRQHFGNRLGKVSRAEAGVVADDQALLRFVVRVNVVSDGVSHAANVFERVVVGDDAAPSVSSELDFSGHRDLFHRHEAALYQVFQIFLVEIRHDFAYVLRLFAGGDE